MATFRDFWHKLLRAFGMGALVGPDWVRPSNAITRALDHGATFVTMSTWDEPSAAPPLPVGSPEVASTAGAETPAVDTPPARKGVAA